MIALVMNDFSVGLIAGMIGTFLMFLFLLDK